MSNSIMGPCWLSTTISPLKMHLLVEQISLTKQFVGNFAISIQTKRNFVVLSIITL